MIVLPSGRSRIEHVLFRFDARDCIDDLGIFGRSFGRKVYGVYTRASVRRVDDRLGVEVAVPSGMPMVTYVGGEQCLPFEPPATNLLSYSDDYGQAAWGKTRSSVAAAPSLSAYLLTEDATAGATHFLTAPGASVSAGSIVAGSVDLRAYGRTKATVRVTDSTGVNGAWLAVDLVAGTVGTLTALGTGTPVRSRIVARADGFWRVGVEVLLDPADTVPRLTVHLADAAGNTSYDGDGASGLYIRRAQVEVRTVTSFIPTNGSPVSRAGDLLRFSIPALNPATPFSMFVRARNTGWGNNRARRLMHIGDGSNVGLDPRCGMQIATVGQWQAYLDDGITAQFIGSGQTPLYGVLEGKLSVTPAIGAMGFSRSIDGGAATGGSGSVGTITSWSAPEVMFGSGNADESLMALTHACISRDVLTLEELHDLAGV